MVDITERKQAEEAFLESETRYRTIFEGVADGILIADFETKDIKYANPAICRMLDYTEEEIKNLGVRGIYSKEEHDRVISDFETQAQEEITLVPDIPFLRKDGTVIDVDISATRVFIDGRECNVGCITDITERKHAAEEKEKMQAQLLQAHKMEAIGQLAGGVAHDFNNILTVIQGYSDLLMMKIDDSDPAYHYIRQVHSSAIRAATLTRQLLAFSRKQPMEFIPLNINSTIKDLLKMLTRLIGEDIAIHTELGPDLRTIQADAGNIEQVIMNLAVNSRDAMPEGGKLTIKTENVTIDQDYCDVVPEAQPGRFICISIADTGAGMDKELISHIFEPFFTTKGPGRGTGLGLSVVYGIIKQHKGWINVYSEPGIGTTFKIYLPDSPGRPEEKSEETISLQDLQNGGERILVVEDEEGVRELAGKGLCENGYVVFSATNAQEAIDIFEKEKGNMDLIFSDMVLPDKSGIQLVEKILEANPGVRALITSGYADDKSQWATIREKGFKFLQKPYTISDLLQAVRC